MGKELTALGRAHVAAASETLRMQGKLVNGRLPENVVFRSRVPRDGCGAAVVAVAAAAAQPRRDELGEGVAPHHAACGGAGAGR